ncbi:MAG TPA: ABC-F family ATP-binding cassette domain-containing protein [Syntrophales bacterium]|nr:ABC-F family ATP-binding cassette domain-containing protein [Syntrophales bacterium]HPI56209.1 ABC-F family ATP-binding cassette domain-containing protein [Syntrophales bacterium]HPN24397.1 ABC-F family ATP-binding cassette domain-containing protein [Syntrophales bacterium]HQM29027.1 ABC-F family ATP-binding cassette domain-containing protein [Syntrophales bacterium]
MISLQGISKQYGGRYLFRDLTIRINEGEKVAVVGPNGAGKTTLMKIIAGIVEADTGRVNRPRSATTGYLPQEAVRYTGRTLLDEVRLAFDEILSLHAQMEGLSVEIADRTVAGDPDPAGLKELLSELGKIQHHVEHLEGYDIDVKIKQVLSGLGFRGPEFGRMTEEFSGGWQMRIELSKLLLREPTCLLLDEPTNHLDIQSLQWLESYLQSYDGAVILVSHDRRFLDNLVGRVFEISAGAVSEYVGNYSDYLGQASRRKTLREAAYRNQQQEIRQTLRFVERYRAEKTRARQAQSRLRRLEKMELIEPENEEAVISFDLPEPPQASRVVMEIRELGKYYGSQPVFSDLSISVQRSDRIALLGVNGSGKSTLVRIMAGLEDFQEGRCEPGYKAVVSYYAQNQAEALDPSKTVLQTLEEVATKETNTRLRTLLGSFLFRDEDVFKPVSVLSGGEKSRLALAKMLLVPANLLLFDEPTNHLDLRSKEVLKRALESFPGAYIIVSHDRDFLDGLVGMVWEMEEGVLRVAYGSVDEYLEKSRLADDDKTVRRDTAGRAIKAIKGHSPLHLERMRKRDEAKKRQERFDRLKPLKDELEGLQREIGAGEAKKKEMEALFADGKIYQDEKKTRAAAVEYRELTARLDTLYVEWEEIQNRIDAVETEG